MAAIANITVKANDGSTDVIWYAQVGAGGDVSPARWESVAAGEGSVQSRPSFELRSRWNGPKTVRRLDGVIVFPQAYEYPESSGLAVVANRSTFSFSVALPTAMSTATMAEMVAQAANLLKATAIQDSLKSGYAPT